MPTEAVVAQRERIEIRPTPRIFNRARWWGTLLARLAFGLLALITSFYCLLAYLPLGYFTIVKNPVLPWIEVFSSRFFIFYVLCAAGLCCTLLPDLRNARRLTIELIALLSVGGAVLAAFPPLPRLTNDFGSYVDAFVPLIVLLLVAMVDFCSTRNESFMTSAPVSLGIVLLTATAIAAASALTVWIDGTSIVASVRAVGVAWSVVAHVALLTLMFAILGFSAWCTQQLRTPWRLPVQVAFWSLLLALFVRQFILREIAFTGRPATLFSVGIGLAFAAYGASTSRRLQTDSDGPSRSARSRLVVAKYGALMLLIAAGIWLPSVIAPFDWHRLFQHLLIFVLWILASVCAAQFSRQQPRFRPAMIVVVGLLALIVLKGMNVAEAGDFTHTQRLSRMLRSYTAADVSYDALRTLNTRIWERDKDQSFYAFLAKNSDLDPHGIRPANFALAPANQFPAELPNIFIFVVDSLRQDYIAPYNPRVTFAPNIAAFAKESVVFKNAFSRYGGTALSEPAIWAGALQLHTKYIEPYYPMNSLEKLAAAAHYDCYVTEDEVVRQLLDPAHKLNRLDELNSGPRWMKVDLPETLKELEADIEGRKSKDPIFVYTQAQNLHAVELYTIENVRKRARNYPGFDDLRASEVERLDHGFGEFIEYLKQKGMYEHSVIVLTSDHGDNLGELGRWGHFGLFPQVMRVPLIVHLPPELQKQVFWDPEAPAFSLDITPSLYYLLGQRPIANNELFGRPLFTQSRTELGQYRRSWYLVASSYGPAYGILSGDGRWLYISDGVERNDYYFDMAADPEGLDNLIDSQARKENESRIREGIEAINQFYRYSPK